MAKIGRYQAILDVLLNRRRETDSLNAAFNLDLRAVVCRCIRNSASYLAIYVTSYIIQEHAATIRHPLSNLKAEYGLEIAFD